MEQNIKARQNDFVSHQQESNHAIPSEFQISAAASQGGRKYMEDRLQIEVGRRPNGEIDFIFAAIYDGHGGVQASDYVWRHLFGNIVNNPSFNSKNDNEVLEAIKQGFLRTHLNMHKIAEQWPPTSSGFACTAGTTATCVFIRNGKLYTGHVGDSSIILANFMEEEAGYDDAKLTNDHKPESLSERQRIEKAGGAVASKSGIVRVIWKRPIRGHRGPVRRSTSCERIPFLAVARSLGDFWSMNPDNNQYVVSPEPDVDVFCLKGSDNFLVLASDGLTNVVGVRTIVQILRDIDEKNSRQKEHAITVGGVNIIDHRYPLNYAHSLMQNSYKKWGLLRADNISIIAIKLHAHALPLDHPSVAEEGPALDVGRQLTDHPFAMFHVNNATNIRLNTNPMRHLYLGSLDKGLDFQAIRFGFGRALNGNNSTRRMAGSTKQQGGGGGTEYFTGPGFVLPEIPSEDNEFLDDDIAADHAPSPSLCDSESDAEEAKNGGGGGAEMGLKVTELGGKKAAVNNGNGEAGTLALSAPKVGPHQKQGIMAVCNGKAAQSQGSPSKLGSFPRSGVKRRLQDSEDSYAWHMPSTSTILSGTKKISLEEEQNEGSESADVKPPPAKRSKLQSVFNFFTSFWKW